MLRRLHSRGGERKRRIKSKHGQQNREREIFACRRHRTQPIQLDRQSWAADTQSLGEEREKFLKAFFGIKKTLAHTYKGVA